MSKTRKGKNKLNVEQLKKFIKEIEELGKGSNNSYLEMIVSSANNFITYGEYRIALEIALDNLYEGSVFLDEEVVNLARQAYGKNITLEDESILKMLTKK